MWLDTAHYALQYVQPKCNPVWALSDCCTIVLFGAINDRSQLSCTRSYCLLSCLCCILGTDLLIVASSVVFNPHFLYFFPSEVLDSDLDSVQSWPAGSAILLLDSFEPIWRAQILVKAMNHHCDLVCVLCQDQHSVSAASDLLSLCCW